MSTQKTWWGKAGKRLYKGFQWVRVLLISFGLVLNGVLPSHALPQGGSVVEGQANIVIVSPNEIKIEQLTDKIVIEWTSFDIAAGENVHFLQPNEAAWALNRVLGGQASKIMGQLSANGGLVLVNPNGILIGSGARVDVNKLVATTIDVANNKFMAGKFEFDIAGKAGASIVNKGLITASEGGLVALVGPGVANHGIIQARLGKVELASGTQFTLDLYGDGLIKIPVGADVQGVRPLNPLLIRFAVGRSSRGGAHRSG